MKRFISPITALVLAQAAQSLLATYFISKISLIGKVGIALFYKQYKLLRSGWKTFFLFFGIQLLIIGLLWYMQQKRGRRKTVYTAAIFMILAIIGLVMTYHDFQYTYSHRLLKERFHLGFYLFWIGWMASCIFFMIANKRNDSISTIDQHQNNIEVPNNTFGKIDH